MKSKFLQSITQKLFLSTALIGSVLFTSCSRSLTSMQSSQKLQNQEVLVTKTSKVAPQAILKPQNEKGIAVALAQPDDNVLKPVAPAYHSTSIFKTRPIRLAAKTIAAKKQILNKVENRFAAVQSLTKNTRVMSANHANHPTFSGDIRRGIFLIAIGLIIYLVGVLLFGPIGTVFYIIGSIFLIVGLIYLIFGLLGNM